MSGIGPIELVVVLVIVVLSYALSRLPEFGGALGKGIGEFRQAAKDAKAVSCISSDANPGEGASTTNPKT